MSNKLSVLGLFEILKVKFLAQYFHSVCGILLRAILIEWLKIQNQKNLKDIAII